MLAFPHVCTEDTNAHLICPTFAARHGTLHSLNLISLVFQHADFNTTAINFRMLIAIGSIAHFHPHASLQAQGSRAPPALQRCE